MSIRKPEDEKQRDKSKTISLLAATSGRRKDTLLAEMRKMEKFFNEAADELQKTLL